MTTAAAASSPLAPSAKNSPPATAVLSHLALPHATAAERSDEIRFEAPVLLSGFRLDDAAGATLSVFARDLETDGADGRLAVAVAKVVLSSSFLLASSPSSFSSPRTFAVAPPLLTDRVVLRGCYGALRGALLGVDLASAAAAVGAAAAAAAAVEAKEHEEEEVAAKKKTTKKKKKGAASAADGPAAAASALDSWREKRSAAVSRWKRSAGGGIEHEREREQPSSSSLRELLRRSELTRRAVLKAVHPPRSSGSRVASCSSSCISDAAEARREE